MFEKGEKVHIVERRYFEDDVRRHFTGEVIDSSDHLLRAEGNTWVFNNATNTFLKKEGRQERVFCLSNRLTIHLLPKEIPLEYVKYSYDNKEGHCVTAGHNFTLNIAEFGPRG